MVEKKNLLYLLIIIIAVLLLGGCASTSIQELKSDAMINKEVTVKGTVKESFKFNKVIGCVLILEDGELIVSSQNTCTEQEEITIKGTMQKDPVVGYYLKETKKQ